MSLRGQSPGSERSIDLVRAASLDHEARQSRQLGHEGSFDPNSGSMPRGSVVTSGPSRLSDTAANPAPRQAPPGELPERRLSSLGPVPSLVEDEIEKSVRWHDEAMAEPDCRYLLSSD